MAIHIKEIIGDFFKDSQAFVEKRKKFDMIIAPYLQGKIKNNILFNKIEKNTVFFHSVSSVFSYEFNLNKDKLLNAIKKEFPHIECIKVEQK